MVNNIYYNRKNHKRQEEDHQIYRQIRAEYGRPYFTAGGGITKRARLAYR